MSTEGECCSGEVCDWPAEWWSCGWPNWVACDHGVRGSCLAEQGMVMSVGNCVTLRVF